MKIKISDVIRNEWDVRAIGSVIPALNQIDYAKCAIEVDAQTAQEIAADCKFYIDPNAVDASIGERSAYRALLRQIEGQS